MPRLTKQRPTKWPKWRCCGGTISLYRIINKPETKDPVLVLALAGWVDAAVVGTGAANHLAAESELVAEFDPDELFDYRANRPTLRFYDGKLEEETWIGLELRHKVIGDWDLLVLTGAEPDLKWKTLGDDLVELCDMFGVTRLITLGGVPAAAAHTRPPTVTSTTSDDSLVLEDDDVLTGTLIVPGGLVSTLTQAVTRAGIPAIGYWVQVPHYLGDRYHAGIIALLDKIAGQLGTAIPLDDLREQADAQRTRLDEVVASRPEAQAYVERLESAAGNEPMPSAEEIGAEVERFLRDTATDDDPFRTDFTED